MIRIKTTITFCLLIVVFTIKLSAQNEKEKYPWLNTQFNYLQYYGNSVIDKLHQNWKDTIDDKFVIVYMGDSHIQSDILPGELRKQLQTKHGKGGRGFVFPYSAAKSYSSIHFKSNYTGSWQFAKSFILPPKIPLGVVGMAVKTHELNASFTITFNEALPDHYTKVKFYCKREEGSYDVKIVCDTSEQIIAITSDTIPYIEFEIPGQTKKISVKTIKNNSNDSFLEFYGMDIQSRNDTGCVVHLAGVGAAMFKAVLYQKLLPEQLPHLEPDLVILDYGTNDYLYNDKLDKNLSTTIIKSIDIIQKAYPETSVLLTSAQDLYWKSRNCRAAIPFHKLIHEIAKGKGCLVWDWFWIAGGQTIMKKWVATDLAQKDMIHLTMSGYKLKGKLLSDALENTMSMYNDNSLKDTLSFAKDSLIILETRKLNSMPMNDYYSPGKGEGYWYNIKSGDSLSKIAIDHRVSVSQIKRWNNLTSDIIIAGKKLWIGK